MNKKLPSMSIAEQTKLIEQVKTQIEHNKKYVEKIVQIRWGMIEAQRELIEIASVRLKEAENMLEEARIKDPTSILTNQKFTITQKALADYRQTLTDFDVLQAEYFKIQNQLGGMNDSLKTLSADTLFGGPAASPLDLGFGFPQKRNDDDNKN